MSGVIQMLNNTEYKIQPRTLDEMVTSQALFNTNVAQVSAANAAQFDQKRNEESRLRRERRYRRNNALANIGWRVTSW